MITITLQKESPTVYKLHFEDKTSTNEGSNIELYKIISKTEVMYIKTYKIIPSYAPCDFTVLYDTTVYNPKQHEIRISGNMMSIDGRAVRKVKVSKLINDFERSQIRVRDVPPSFHEFNGPFSENKEVPSFKKWLNIQNESNEVNTKRKFFRFMSGESCERNNGEVLVVDTFYYAWLVMRMWYGHGGTICILEGDILEDSIESWQLDNSEKKYLQKFNIPYTYEEGDDEKKYPVFNVNVHKIKITEIKKCIDVSYNDSPDKVEKYNNFYMHQ